MMWSDFGKNVCSIVKMEICCRCFKNFKIVWRIVIIVICKQLYTTLIKDQGSSIFPQTCKCIWTFILSQVCHVTRSIHNFLSEEVNSGFAICKDILNLYYLIFFGQQEGSDFFEWRDQMLLPDIQTCVIFIDLIKGIVH